MKRLKNVSKGSLVVVKTEKLEEFFSRGKKLAKLLDEKKHVEAKRIISFEDPQDLIKFLAQNKLELVSTVRKKSYSISELAKRLHRSRAAVDKDIQELESIGIVKSTYVTNPGHGRCKMIMAIDKNPIQLQVQTVL